VKLLTSIDDGFGQALCIFRLRPAQHAQGGSRARRAPGVRRLARGRRRVLWRLWRRWKMAAAWWPQVSGRAEMNWDQHAGRMIQLPFPQTNKLLLVKCKVLLRFYPPLQANSDSKVLRILYTYFLLVSTVHVRVIYHVLWGFRYFHYLYK
jgi:hypothetical protein